MDVVAVQKLLFGEPPCDETEATSALFYSISSTQVLLHLISSKAVSNLFWKSDVDRLSSKESKNGRNRTVLFAQGSRDSEVLI